MRKMTGWAALPRGSRGITLPTLVLLVAGLTLIGFGGFRLLPVYIAHIKVAGAMESVRVEYDGEAPTKREIRAALEKRFDIEMINVLPYHGIAVDRKGDLVVLTAKYDNEVPFIGNLHFIVHFNHVVSLTYGN